MIRKRMLISVLSLLVSAGMICSVNAWAYKGEQLAKQAKINLQQAQHIALKAFPGKIIDEELEKEAGGSGLRYSFDIRRGKQLHEVGVDASDGKILENSDDSNDKD